MDRADEGEIHFLVQEIAVRKNHLYLQCSGALLLYNWWRTGYNGYLPGLKDHLVDDSVDVTVAGYKPNSFHRDRQNSTKIFV